ncbi:M23 family metallopeptidase [Roseibium sediminis]|uniref:M23 family metallopeptidase n=1 Tax=Roseibium sediminis TaxID=1775174 RepID=UPI00123E11BA|nr:M23 family metallopeptidase [Roseibium sediminis]
MSEESDMKKQNAYKSSFEQNPYSAPRAPIYSAQRQRNATPNKGLMITALCLLFLMAIGATGFGTYVYLKEDIHVAASVETSEMELEYQDKIARLRLEIDRLNSRQIVDRESVEMLVQEIIERQETISRQHQIVSTLMDRAEKSGIKIAAASAVPPSKPSDTEVAAESDSDSDTSENLLAIGGEAEPLTDPLKLLGLRGTGAETAPVAPEAEAKKKDDGEDHAALNAVMHDLEQMDHESYTALNALAVATETKVDRIVAATRPLGIKIKLSQLDNSAVGGPFIPLTGTSFDERVARAEKALMALSKARSEVAKLPVQRPVRKVQISSRFGPRLDPFLRKWALHSGIDFKASYGSRIYSAGPGKVVYAGWQGGYGKVVIIQHAHGYKTRYAHMSRIQVSKGETVTAGTVIGNIGSTGRSTGPHLHYEVRRGDKAIDPSNFIATGDRLKSIDGI